MNQYMDWLIDNYYEVDEGAHYSACRKCWALVPSGFEHEHLDWHGSTDG